MEKVQWNLINKKQNELEQSKNEKSSTLPHAPHLLSIHYSLWGGRTKFLNSQLVILENLWKIVRLFTYCKKKNIVALIKLLKFEKKIQIDHDKNFSIACQTNNLNSTLYMVN